MGTMVVLQAQCALMRAIRTVSSARAVACLERLAQGTAGLVVGASGLCLLTLIVPAIIARLMVSRRRSEGGSHASLRMRINRLRTACDWSVAANSGIRVGEFSQEHKCWLLKLPIPKVGIRKQPFTNCVPGSCYVEDGSLPTTECI